MNERSINLKTILDLIPMDYEMQLIGIHNQGQPVGMIGANKLPRHILEKMAEGASIGLEFNTSITLDQIDWATGEIKA